MELTKTKKLLLLLTIPLEMLILWIVFSDWNQNQIGISLWIVLTLILLSNMSLVRHLGRRQQLIKA